MAAVAESAVLLPLEKLLPADRAFLMELDPGYCDVIRRRYETFVGGGPAK
jgi:hypothetical protein